VTIKPWFPVLDDNGDSPDYRLDFHIYDKDAKEKVSPFTIPLRRGDGGRVLSFNISWGSETKVQYISVEGAEFQTRLEDKSSAKPLMSGSEFIKGSGMRASVITILSQLDEVAPWGLKGFITWEFDLYLEKNSPGQNQQEEIPKLFKFKLRHPIEIYAVSEYRSATMANQLFWRKGIPRTALQFYIIDSKNGKEQAYNDLSQYVAAIVDAVHRKTGHIYDVWNGVPHYTSAEVDEGVVFNLNKWAKHIRGDRIVQGAEAVTPKVNCLDQSAAVWIGICLGLPEDRETADSLLWHWAKPFGFVNGTRLVGWSDASEVKFNNAYFKGDRKKMFIEEVLSQDRDGFWIHHFLAFRGQVLDATCGPIVGDHTTEEYLMKVIDRKAGKVTENKAWRRNIENAEQERILNEFGGAATEKINVMKNGVCDLDSQFWTQPHKRTINESQLQVKAEKKKTIPYSKLQLLLVDIRNKMGFDSPPVDMSSSGEVEKWADIPLPNDVMLLSWEVVRNGAGSILVKVHLAPDEVAAKAIFKKLLEDLGRPVEQVFQRYKDQESHLIGIAVESGWHLWQEHNVVVSISGLKSNEQLEPYVLLVGKYLVEEEAKLKKRTKIIDIQVLVNDEVVQSEKDIYKCKVGDVLQVKVKAVYAAEFSLNVCRFGVSHCPLTKRHWSCILSSIIRGYSIGRSKSQRSIRKA
jgi:hypothetical protein